MLCACVCVYVCVYMHLLVYVCVCEYAYEVCACDYVIIQYAYVLCARVCVEQSTSLNKKGKSRYYPKSHVYVRACASKHAYKVCACDYMSLYICVEKTSYNHICILSKFCISNLTKLTK